MVSERPNDRSGASVCGALDAPSWINNERRPRLHASCRLTADDGVVVAGK